MICFVVLIIVCVMACVTCHFILKKYKYTKTINMVMDNFDYFLTSICIEQTSNKYFIFCSEWKDNAVMQDEFSEISALSYIECACISICMFISSSKYTPNDKIYILKIIKSNYRIMKKMYDNYIITIKYPERRKFFIYNEVEMTQCISFERFCRVVDELTS